MSLAGDDGVDPTEVTRAGDFVCMQWVLAPQSSGSGCKIRNKQCTRYDSSSMPDQDKWKEVFDAI